MGVQTATAYSVCDCYSDHSIQPVGLAIRHVIRESDKAVTRSTF